MTTFNAPVNFNARIPFNGIADPRRLSAVQGVSSLLSGLPSNPAFEGSTGVSLFEGRNASQSRLGGSQSVSIREGS